MVVVCIMYGCCLHYVWLSFALCMVVVCIVYGCRLHYVWLSFALCMVVVCIVYGCRLHYVWLSFALCMVVVCIVYGCRLHCVWLSFALCMVVVCIMYGCRLHYVWLSFALCMVVGKISTFHTVRKKQRGEKCPDLALIPPQEFVLRYHTKRANTVAYIWRNSISTDINVEYQGWNSDGNIWMDSAFPPQIEDILFDEDYDEDSYEHGNERDTE